jgi:MYXO-CTERM domain-containing protein
MADKNYILTDAGMWFRSSTLGLQGDWIIRAFVNGSGPGPTDAGPDAGPNVTPDAPMTGNQCSGNAQCPQGQFCDLAQGACTFECRTDDDCGGGNCNSLGQCVGGGTSSGGCCRADGGGGSTGALLGLGLLLVWRRRRR